MTSGSGRNLHSLQVINSERSLTVSLFGFESGGAPLDSDLVLETICINLMGKNLLIPFGVGWGFSMELTSTVTLVGFLKFYESEPYFINPHTNMKKPVFF